MIGSALDAALTRLGLDSEADLETLDDAGRELLALAVRLDEAYEAWLRHRHTCPSCRHDRPCETGRELAERYTAAWCRLHPPAPRRGWGRCTTCGERTPLVLRGQWACASHGGRPVPTAGGGDAA
jgi:hypothetical protein